MSRILIAVVIVTSFLNYVKANEICCPGLGCYSDAPPWFGFPLPQCPEDMGMNMQVYTRRNPTDGQLITRNSTPSVFDGSLMTVFIVHGWLQDETFPWMTQMKDAFLAVVDWNVIIVGWPGGSKHLSYPLVASNTRTAGGEIALVSNNTIDNNGSTRARQYCVGHSLGGHVCGQAGQQGQFGRISGLDAAGPLFQQRDWSCGLNPFCADRVEDIHTDGMGLGTLKRLGHVDFYPNGGYFQPGCAKIALDGLFNYQYLLSNTEDGPFYKLAELAIGCNHNRAILLFIESIQTPCFLSRYNCSDPYFLPASCTASSNAVQNMGFRSIDYSNEGIFYLTTNGESPFCQN